MGWLWLWTHCIKPLVVWQEDESVATNQGFVKTTGRTCCGCGSLGGGWLRLRDWRFVKTTGRKYRSSPFSQITGATAALIPRRRLWLYTTREKLQLRPSTTVPILDNLVCGVVGEGASVLMRVGEVENLTAVSIRMLQFGLL